MIGGNMKKIFKFLLIFVIVIIIIAAAIIAFVFFNSDKYVCKSKEGNITILYRDGKITGNTAKNINYDLKEQQERAEKVGIEEYLKEFKQWFESNTSGTCEYEKK
jgi:flagellar basal body-associated protein FliL